MKERVFKRAFKAKYAVKSAPHRDSIMAAVKNFEKQPKYSFFHRFQKFLNQFFQILKNDVN